MNDANRKVINPLFNAAVTGGTFEEFSQNAILLPAKEKTPPPTLNINPDQLLNTILGGGSPQNTEALPPNLEQVQQTEPLYPEPVVQENSFIHPQNLDTSSDTSQRSSNFSSVFSSFSSILNFSSQNNSDAKQEQVHAVPPPAGIESFINHDNTNVEPVPLFPAVSTIPQPVTTNQGPVNVFRRPGLKRPAYAKVPGLSNTTTTQASPSLGSLPPVQNTPPVPQPVPFQPETSTLPQPPLPLPPATCALSQPPIPQIPVYPQPTAAAPVVPLQPAASQSLPQPPTTSTFSQTSVPLQPLTIFSEPLTQPQPATLFSQSQAPVPPQLVPSISPQPIVPGNQAPLPSAPPQSIVHPYQFPSVPAQPTPATYFTSYPAAQPLSHQDLPNQFKPISPPPPSLNDWHISQPQIIPSQPVTQFLQPIKAPSLFSDPPVQYQSPVMDAIPASEALQNNVLNSTNSFGTTNLNENNASLNQVYRPVYHHWFFQKEVEGKKLWQPFSMVDSLVLEQAFISNDLDPDKVIATDGGRFDVNILRRQRTPVYWQGAPTEVRRCSWFHKSSPDGRLVPYEENIATKLEEEFKTAFELNQWHRKVELASGETVVIHGPDVLVLFPPSQTPDAWGNTPNQTRPRVVKRGMDEFDIDEGEPTHVDHILFMVHGIGSVCDFKFRAVEEVVDEFRNIALQLVQSHYRTSCENGIIHRVEVLPISWHFKLHSDETGIDKQLKGITLESIPKLRDFTNDTLLDILFYTSPVYCQTIISTVGNELNRVYDLFKQRNPAFNGGVSLGGHSLGSLILFDLLCHQHPQKEKEEESEDVLEDDVFPPQDSSKPSPPKRKMSRRISYMMGGVGTGQPQIYYPHLNFEPKTFFALGSPIGMFVIIRGLDTLGENFSLPTCPAFFNIFHPYDPIAYRIESLIRPELGKLKPVLIPHHKGRKRMHLELKETMARVGADLKQKVIDSMKSTWNSFYQLAMFHKPDQSSLEEEVQKAFQKELDSKAESEEDSVQEVTNIPLINLNKGRRVDYVLQEAPFEFINEYIFALTSHVCYWESEDTILLMLKEIYSSMGFSTDNQIPQQTMTIERPPPSPTSLIPDFTTPSAVGMDPTQPIQVTSNLQPPPTSGFVKKT